MTNTNLTGDIVTATVPAEHIVAAGVGSQVTYERPGWTVGDMRAMLATLPTEFDANPILIHSGGQPAAHMRTASMQIDPANATTTLALHTTR